MATIKNIDLLNDISGNSISGMESRAKELKQSANISIKVKEYDGMKVIFQTVQGKSSLSVYYSQKELRELVKESFESYFPGKKIMVHAICFNQNPVNEVNTRWINKKMLDTGTKVKDISSDTGIDTTEVKNFINGSLPLSQPVKAMFYYYFLNR